LALDPESWRRLVREWNARFAGLLQRPFRVCFHDNRSTMISFREERGWLTLRLHHMFLEASEEVLRALAGYVGGRGGSSVLLDAFIDQHRAAITRRPFLYGGFSRGRVYDLVRIRDALDRAYFSGAAAGVLVVWGRPRHVRGQRSLRLGSYSFEDRVVRIHPTLDRDDVPPYVVVGVVYHELLHHVLGCQQQDGRRRIHTAEFKRREAAYVHHRRARIWERHHLDRLLRRNRRRPKA